MTAGSLAQVAWPGARMGEALEALAKGRAGKGGSLALAPEAALPARSPGAAILRDGAALQCWMDLAAAKLGLEAEPVEAAYADAAKVLRHAGPSIVRLPGGGEPSFLALLPGGGQRLRILAPDGTVRRVPPEEVRSALCHEIEKSISPEADRVLVEARILGKRREIARKALLCELLPAARVSGAWMVRPAGTAALRFQGREAKLRRLFVLFSLSLLSLQVLWVGTWWLLGRGALEGRLDTGWLAAWALMLASWIPLQLAATWTSGLLSIRVGALLKRRLLAGALKLQSEDVRHLGTGGFLGRIIESSVVEQMSVTGAFLLASSLIELSLAGLVLSQGAGGALHVALLLCWLGLAAWMGARLGTRMREWTRARLEMTNDVVERMAGHRTRLAQESAERWHEGEDEALDSYVALSLELDRAAVAFQALLPRGWMILGLLGLAPAFIFGGKSLASFAVGIGGMLLGVQAFRHLADGLERSLAALVAWRWVKPFWDAAGRVEPLGEPEFAWPAGAARAGAGDGAPLEDRGGSVPLLDLREVTFCHRARTEPVLRKVDLKVWAGDRMLLEGPSGGGKSTLASLISGARNVGSGLLLLRGLDREVVGKEGWRRHVVLVPQFHENHVFLGSFAFNALMGRGWPPSVEDFKEAERVCRALGLGPLLERMPGGLLQSVGETGWQLSHGERSRLYIARALLQGAEVTILDESLAALDPETLRRNLGFVLEKASTLIVIAHP